MNPHNSPAARTPLDTTALAAVADLPPLVPLEDVATFFHVDARTVRRWARTGKLHTRRTAPGGSGRVLVARVEIARVLTTMDQPVAFDGR